MTNLVLTKRISSSRKTMWRANIALIAVGILLLSTIISCGRPMSTPNNSAVHISDDTLGQNPNPGKMQTRRGANQSDLDLMPGSLQNRLDGNYTSQIVVAGSVSTENIVPQGFQSNESYSIDRFLNLTVRQFFRVTLSAYLLRKEAGGNVRQEKLEGAGYRIKFVILSRGTGEPDFNKRYISSFETEATFYDGNLVIDIPFKIPWLALASRAVIDEFGVEILPPKDVPGFKAVTFSGFMQPSETNSSFSVKPADWHAGEILDYIDKNGGPHPAAPGAQPAIPKETALELLKKEGKYNPLTSDEQVKKASKLSMSEAGRIMDAPAQSLDLVKKVCDRFFEPINRKGFGYLFNLFKESDHDRCVANPDKALSVRGMKLIRSNVNLLHSSDEASNFQVSAGNSFGVGSGESETESVSQGWRIGGLSAGLDLFGVLRLTIVDASARNVNFFSNVTVRATDRSVSASFQEFRALTRKHVRLEFEAIYDQCLLIAPVARNLKTGNSDVVLKTKEPLFVCKPDPIKGTLAEDFYFFSQIWQGVTPMHNPNASALAIFFRGEQKYFQFADAMTNAANTVQFHTPRDLHTSKNNTTEKFRQVFKDIRNDEIPGLIVN